MFGIWSKKEQNYSHDFLEFLSARSYLHSKKIYGRKFESILGYSIYIPMMANTKANHCTSGSSNDESSFTPLL